MLPEHGQITYGVRRVAAIISATSPDWPAMQEIRIPENLALWVESSLAEGRNVLAESNQGTILLFTEAGAEFVVKTAMGAGAIRRAREATLQREYQAYRRMADLEGVPRCHGMVQGRFLVLEYVRGEPYRGAAFEDRERWFAQLLEVIRGFHHRGVSHGDLKSKSNLMVTSEGRPCVLDFGTSFVEKPGFHPLNNRMFAYGKRLDMNAWVKHKYHGRYQDASPRDRELLNYSALEQVLRKWRRRNMGS